MTEADLATLNNLNKSIKTCLYKFDSLKTLTESNSTATLKSEKLSEINDSVRENIYTAINNTNNITLKFKKNISQNIIQEV